MDRRHQDVKTDSLIVAGILLTMGWYASPFQPLDTLFTQRLAQQDLETFWSILFGMAGALKAAVAILRARGPRWLCFASNWLAALISLWTGMLFVGGPLTPTIMACWVIGFGSLASMFRDARQQQKLRGIYGVGRTESST